MPELGSQVTESEPFESLQQSRSGRAFVEMKTTITTGSTTGGPLAPVIDSLTWICFRSVAFGFAIWFHRAERIPLLLSTRSRQPGLTMRRRLPRKVQSLRVPWPGNGKLRQFGRSPTGFQRVSKFLMIRRN